MQGRKEREAKHKTNKFCLNLNKRVKRFGAKQTIKSFVTYITQDQSLTSNISNLNIRENDRSKIKLKRIGKKQCLKSYEKRIQGSNNSKPQKQNKQNFILFDAQILQKQQQNCKNKTQQKSQTQYQKNEKKQQIQSQIKLNFLSQQLEEQQPENNSQIFSELSKYEFNVKYIQSESDTEEKIEEEIQRNKNNKISQKNIRVLKGQQQFIQKENHNLRVNKSSSAHSQSFVYLKGNKFQRSILEKSSEIIVTPFSFIKQIPVKKQEGKRSKISCNSLHFQPKHSFNSNLISSKIPKIQEISIKKRQFKRNTKQYYLSQYIRNAKNQVNLSNNKKQREK